SQDTPYVVADQKLPARLCPILFLDCRDCIGDRIRGSLQVVLGMQRRQEESQARLPFLRRGINDGMDVDATLEQTLRNAQRLHRTADYARPDGGAGACAGVEPMLAYLFREKGGSPTELVHTLRLPPHNAKRGQCGGAVGRRESDAVDEARRRI